MQRRFTYFRRRDNTVRNIPDTLEETLIVVRLGLRRETRTGAVVHQPDRELFGRVREINRRVNAGRTVPRLLRWTAAGVLEAECGFRKIVNYRAMPTLVAALHGRNAQFNRYERGVDDTKKAA
jgi:hypothetical protein